MSLSSLIVQRQVATMRQVEEALARQVIYGGDLVTNLLEVAPIDEQVLAPLLGETAQLAPAPAGELPPISHRVLALVPPEMAAERLLVPLSLEGQRLVVAVAEPLGPVLVEELSFALGLILEQRAAPAVRVRQALSRAYGVPLERRMQRLLSRLAGQTPPAGSMPPPLAASPEVPASPGAPSSPSPRPRAEPRGPQHPTDGPPPPAFPLDLSPEETPAPNVAPRAALFAREAAAQARAARRRRGPITFDVAKHEADQAPDRDALLDLYFDFSRQFFDFAALFLVHGDIAEGRDAFGTGATRERVAGIGIPLDLPSLFARARDKRLPVVAKAPPDGLDAEVLADLLRPRDAEVAIVPLLVRARAVALLVGDCGETGIDRASAKQVVAFATVVGKAFERIIVRRKLEGLIASNTGSKPPPPPAAAPRKSPARTGRGKASPRAQVPLSSQPPPRANIASVRPIAGPPIPREDPGALRSSVHDLAVPYGRKRSSPPPETPMAQAPAADAEDAMAAPQVADGAVAALAAPELAPPIEPHFPEPEREQGPRGRRATKGRPGADAKPAPTEDHPGSGPRPRQSSSMPPTAAASPMALRDGSDLDGGAPESDEDPDFDSMVIDELSRETGHGRRGKEAATTLSAAVAVAPHSPPAPRPSHTPALPKVMVDLEDELAELLARVVSSEPDELAEAELLRQGERAMGIIMESFPGPVSVERSSLTTAGGLPRASECGPLLRLVARQRKVALPFVLERLTSPDPEVRGWATHLLGELPYTEAIPHLLARLRDVDAATSASAARAVGAVGRVYPEATRAAVSELARSADPLDRAAAMRAAAELRDVGLVSTLVGALKDEDAPVAAAAHGALVQVSRQDFGSDARLWLRWLEHNGHRHRLEWLIDALTHDNAEIRAAAGEELRVASDEQFGYSSDLPPRDRDRAQQRYRDWWATDGRARFRNPA